MRNLLLLDTMEAAHHVTKDKKTCTYKIYDFTNGGIDIPSQQTGCLTRKQKTRRWTLAASAYVLDICRVSSQAIYAMNTRNASTKGFELGLDLIILLMKPYMSNRITIGSFSSNLEESDRSFLCCYA